MNKKPSAKLVSIVTPVYNAARFITDTIESVLNQTYEDWELILVDDCSQDSSFDIINSYAKGDYRIKVIKLEKNQGAAVARNTGLEHAKGQYIAFVDSDDIWDMNKLTKQLSFMEEVGCGFSYTNYSFITEDGQLIKESIRLPEKLDYTGLLKNTAIGCSTVVIDRNIVGDFRMPLVRKGQDTATWLKLMRERDLTAWGLDIPLTSYRQVKGSVSSNRLGALKRTWHTYRVLEGLPLYKSIYYFIHYAVNAVLRRI